MKEKIYEALVNIGTRSLKWAFPEYFGKDPLGATDRWIEYPWAIKKLSKQYRHKVLDIGCTGSMFPLILSAYGYDVYGIDIRKYQLEGDFCFFQEDITKKSILEIQNLSTITAISTIEHIKHDIKAISRISSMLRPGGQFLMTVPYGPEFKVTQFHKIHTMASLRVLLGRHFRWGIEIQDSPESKDYQLALIEGVKN